MKNEEKILKYLSDSLTSEEKVSFEKEIESSDILKSEFNKTKNLFLEMNNSSKIEIDDKISLFEKSLINFILAKKEKKNKNHKKEIEYINKINAV